ncbi:HNH endonuclease family protein [Halotia branconii]|uniref:HNH endonuclease family protein n=1 Tax=Halotia branconii CENA392 TaxID=1539056 RepID=A0AAJ6P9L9_9CYAN|nr:HNH endonuclease family protein [Halotia branconii]WGV25875.1 HNH endonuclease family protein [Halotia branconii CENA392]
MFKIKKYEWLLENNTICKYEETPFEFVKDLLNAAKSYKSLVERKNPADNSENPHLANIKYLSPNLKQHLYMLLAARDMSINIFTQLCLHIENFIFVYGFPNNSMSELERLFINWGQEIRRIAKTEDREQQLSDLKIFIDSTLGERKENLRKSFEKKFSEASQLDFNSRGTNKKPTSNANKKTKYILAKISQYIQMIGYSENDEYQNLTTFTQSSIEIEHILPQDLNSEPIKTFDNQDEVETYIYKLGNLALLEQTLNSSIQNSSFDIKKRAYKQSNFLLTQCISDKPSIGNNTAINRAVEDLISFQEWNSQSIEKRQEMLKALALKIWYEEVSFRKDIPE